MLLRCCVLQVGEHLLSLVQELEAFASSDALRDLVVTSGEAGALAAHSAGWQQLRSLLGIRDVSPSLRRLHRLLALSLTILLLLFLLLMSID